MTRERLEFFAARAQKAGDAAIAAMRAKDFTDLESHTADVFRKVLLYAESVSNALTAAAKEQPYTPEREA